MKSLTIFLVLLSVGGIIADQQLDAVYSAYKQNDLDQARELMRQLPSSSTRDGNRLFITALLEPDAVASRKLLKAAINSNLDGKYAEQAHFLLIQLAEMAGDTADSRTRAEIYLNNWENSRYREQLLALLAAHQIPESDEENRYLNLLIDESPGSYFGQSARLIKANYAFNKKHYKTTETQCRRINNTAGDYLVPSSLILLSRVGLQRGQTERALLNYNILQEQYQGAIGQERLVEALKNVSEEESNKESGEVFEGVTYSIQVGVFGVKDNARDMSDRVKAYGYKARITKRNISDKQYYVVLAGKFKNLHEAKVAKEKLELGENEIYKVIVND